MCRTRNVKEVTFTKPQRSKHNYFLGSVTKGQKEESWCVSLQIGASSPSFKVNSGADVTTLDVQTYKSMANPPDMRPTSNTSAGAGGEITCYGKFRQRQQDQRIESTSSMSTSLTVAAYWVEQTHLHSRSESYRRADD